MKDLKTDSTNILIIGIGNCGRGDDGLGWKFTSLVENAGHPLIDCEYRYQLQIEDATLIGEYDWVFFADASHRRLKNGFEISPCTASSHYYYSSHMQSPETILYLASDLYNKFPKAYTIAISGYHWDLKTSTSKKADKNLESAFAFFKNEFLLPLIGAREDKNILIA